MVNWNKALATGVVFYVMGTTMSFFMQYYRFGFLSWIDILVTLLVSIAYFIMGIASVAVPESIK